MKAGRSERYYILSISVQCSTICATTFRSHRPRFSVSLSQGHCLGITIYCAFDYIVHWAFSPRHRYLPLTLQLLLCRSWRRFRFWFGTLWVFQSTSCLSAIASSLALATEPPRVSIEFYAFNPFAFAEWNSVYTLASRHYSLSIFLYSRYFRQPELNFKCVPPYRQSISEPTRLDHDRCLTVMPRHHRFSGWLSNFQDQ